MIKDFLLHVEIGGLPQNCNGRFRRLSSFPDKEMKVRVIGILDYWSQTVLKPVHEYMFNVLRKIPQDCTFNQGSFMTKLPTEGPYYSIDLSAATDRFPMELICKVLEGQLPPEWVSHWKSVMVDYPFEFNGRMVKYTTGNPMGAYSSWASFAIAHHYVIYYCCRTLNLDWHKCQYVLLGDDIVIANKEVAELYLTTMSSLGVDISMEKTHISNCMYEFAKRLVLNNTEITPFPISALRESSRRYYLLVNLLLETESKGWKVVGSIPDAVSSFYGIIRSLPSRYRKKMSDKSYDVELIMKVMRGLVPAGEAVTAIARKHNLPLPVINDEVATSIFSNIAVELFTSSNPENDDGSKPTKPLGLLAEELVIRITFLEEKEVIPKGLSSELILSFPHLAVYGQVERLYLHMKREARMVDTVNQGDWPFMLRSMTLPMSDEIFIMRTSHLIPYSSSIMSRLLLERLQILVQYPQLLT